MERLGSTVRGFYSTYNPKHIIDIEIKTYCKVEYYFIIIIILFLLFNIFIILFLLFNIGFNMSKYK